MMSYQCYLKRDRRGSYVAEIDEDWTIAGKIGLPKESTFVLWPMGTAKRNPKLLELVLPGEDLVTKAIILVKLHRTKDKGNRYFGQRKVRLFSGKKTIVSTEANFTLFENKEDFGLVVS